MKISSFKSIILLYCFLCICSCSKTIEGDLIIKNVNIIEVKTGNIETVMDVVIDAEKITSIIQHKDNSNYQAETVVDGSDKFLIPGLWDMHAHWIDSYQDFFPMYLANGVIGIRDMWGNLNVLKKVHKLIDDGDIAGPEIFTAGLMVDGSYVSWPGASVIASTPEEGGEIVRQQKANGVDFIKVYSKLERDVYFASADECKKQNISMVGHIPRKISLEEAVQSNHQSIEHFYNIRAFLHPQYEVYIKKLQGEEVNLNLNAKTTERTKLFGIGALDFDLDNFDNSRIPKLVKLLAGSNSYVTPTMVIEKGYFRIYDTLFDPTQLDSYMPDVVIEDYYVQDTLETEEDNRVYDWSIKNNQIITDMLKPMFDGGVKFLAGTDHVGRFIYPGFSSHDELQIFVEEAHVTPLQALQTTTINPANFLNIEENFGTVEVGKIASLVLLNANPLDNINNTRKIEGVILRGKHLSKEKLDDNLKILAERQSKPKIRSVLKPIILEEGIEKAIETYHNLKAKQPDVYNFDKYQLNFLGYDLLES